MAQRRMFSKTITNSSQFLMMPSSAQNLYFHFGMNADDDGFCEHFAIMRMTESKPDDLRILGVRGYVQLLDDKVLVITDWKENNYIQSDRYRPSKYLEIYKKELAEICENKHNLALPFDNQKQMDTSCIQNGYSGKVRLGKVRLESESENAPQNKKTVDELWIEKIKPYLNNYAPSMIELFTNHWRQKNEKGNKELWQMQKQGVFDMSRRLETWRKKDERWEHERQQRRNIPQEKNTVGSAQERSDSGLERITFGI